MIKLSFNMQQARVEIKILGSDFDAQLMEVKKLPFRDYDKVKRAWFVPVNDEVEVPLMLLAARWRVVVPEMVKAAFEYKRERAANNYMLSAADKIPHKFKHVKFKREAARKLYQFQRAGVLYLSQNRRVLLADDMGLGKTAQALIATHEVEGYPALVICPASLKYNWQNEVEKWLPGQSAVIVDNDQSKMTGANIVIINYDRLYKFPILSSIPWRTVIVDESHYCKNYQSRRSQLVKEICEDPENVFLLSGTPVTNKPYDILQQLVILGRVNLFGGFWAFAHKFCNAHEVTYRGGKTGWDFSGAQNLEELNRVLRENCYIRREKSQVLKDLPEKTFVDLEVDILNRPEYERAVMDIIEYVRETKGQEKAAAAARAETLVKISVCRQIAAAGKRWAAVSFVKNLLETTNEKLVLFGWHTDQIIDLMAECATLLNPDEWQGVIIGETSADERDSNVRNFQEDPKFRLLFANIQAGGVGLTLTAASKVLFFEFGWTPAEMAQAADRIHRIGQKENCTIYKIIAKNTIDQHFIKMLADKKNVADEAMDGNYKYIYKLLAEEAGKYDPTRTNEAEPEWEAVTPGHEESQEDYLSDV